MTTHIPAANPHLQKWARPITNKARRRGELVPEPCLVCGTARALAHHEDYAEPLDITWLCSLHHSWRHRYPGHSIEEMVAQQAAA